MDLQKIVIPEPLEAKLHHIVTSTPRGCQLIQEAFNNREAIKATLRITQEELAKRSHSLALAARRNEQLEGGLQTLATALDEADPIWINGHTTAHEFVLALMAGKGSLPLEKAG